MVVCRKACHRYGREAGEREYQKVWKDYTSEDTIIVIDKAMEVIQPEIINSCWRQLARDFTGSMTEPIEKIMNGIASMAKQTNKRGGS